MARITSQPSTELDMLTPFRGAAEGGGKHNLSITRSKATKRFTETHQEPLGLYLKCEISMLLMASGEGGGGRKW